MKRQRLFRDQGLDEEGKMASSKKAQYLKSATKAFDQGDEEAVPVAVKAEGSHAGRHRGGHRLDLHFRKDVHVSI